MALQSAQTKIVAGMLNAAGSEEGLMKLIAGLFIVLMLTGCTSMLLGGGSQNSNDRCDKNPQPVGCT